MWETGTWVPSGPLSIEGSVSEPCGTTALMTRPRPPTGLCHSQAAGCGNLPGRLCFHLRKEYPQHLPDRVHGVSEQAQPGAPEEPCPKPLQATASPPQSFRTHLFYLQEGKGQKLFHYVKWGLEKGGNLPLPPLGCRGTGRGRMGQFRTLDMRFSDGHGEGLEGDRNGTRREPGPA